MMSDEQAQKFHTVDQNGRKNSMNNREVLLEVRGHHNVTNTSEKHEIHHLYYLIPNLYMSVPDSHGVQFPHPPLPPKFHLSPQLASLWLQKQKRNETLTESKCD